MKIKSVLQTIIATQLLVGTAYSGRTEKSMSQYWTETGISFAMEINRKIAPACYQDEKAFVACIAVLNAFAASFEEPAVVIPTNLLGDPDVIHGEKVKRLDVGLSLVKLPKADEKLTLHQMAIRSRTHNLKVIEREKELFRSYVASGQGLDFFSAFEEFREGFRSNTKNKPDDYSAFVAFAVNQFLSAYYDPHTHISPTAWVKDSMQKEDHQFSGVGMSLGMKDKVILVLGLVEGGSAQDSKKIKKGDIILKIKTTPQSEWFDVAGKSLEESVDLIKGPEGTPVSLQMKRGQKDFEITLIRKIVAVKNVSFEILKDFEGSYGYIRLGHFMDETGCKKISEALTQLKAQNVNGVMLDLRGNGGGLLPQAQCISGLFVGPKVVVGQKALQGPNQEIQYSPSILVDDVQLRAGKYRPGKQEYSGPTVVLIDSGSASASEIVSGALQDHQAAWIVGETSFGKATVQGTGPVAEAGGRNNDKITIAQTVARFYQPSGRTNQNVGIQPDFAVPFKPGATEDERFSMREADLFTNALPALGKEWVQPRPQEVSAIQACREKLKWADKKYASVKAEELDGTEYQKWAAEEVLYCAGQVR